MKHAPNEIASPIYPNTKTQQLGNVQPCDTVICELNDEDAKQCRNFESPRAEPERWECSQCKYSNLPAAKKCHKCGSHQGTEDVMNFFRKHNTRAHRADTAPSTPENACESDIEGDTDSWIEQPNEQQTIPGVHQLIPPPTSPSAWSCLKWPQFRLFAGLRASTKDRIVTNAFSIWRVVLQGSGTNLFLTLILTYMKPCVVSNLAGTSRFWAGAVDRALVLSGVRKVSKRTVPTLVRSRAVTAVVKKRNKFKVRRDRKRRQQKLQSEEKA